MTTPGFEARIEQLAQIADADGRMRTSSYENHMDLVAIMEHMSKNRRFKTGELVNDDKGEEDNG